jgi:hypothetical protein
MPPSPIDTGSFIEPHVNQDNLTSTSLVEAPLFGHPHLCTSLSSPAFQISRVLISPSVFRYTLDRTHSQSRIQYLRLNSTTSNFHLLGRNPPLPTSVLPYFTHAPLEGSKRKKKKGPSPIVEFPNPSPPSAQLNNSLFFIRGPFSLRAAASQPAAIVRIPQHCFRSVPFLFLPECRHC